MVGPGHPAYVIAEIGSNFDGDLDRAKMLARLAKEAGADAYKIQNFLAPKIVSDEGFKDLKIGYQANWTESVVEVYRKAEFPREWVKEIADYCSQIGIDFMSSAWDTEAVDLLESVGVVAHKIGSGEVDNLEFISHVAKTGKPIFLATGTATNKEVAQAVETIRKAGNENIILMQCIVNYPSSVEEANLKAMVSMGQEFSVPFGYSDHSIGASGGGDDPLNGLLIPLGMAALGGCVIEKHVSDDPSRKGPDHTFAMTFSHNFTQMVLGIHAMEKALGDGIKRTMPSEKDTAIIMRRGMFLTRDLAEGESIAREDIEMLRPAVGMRPPRITEVVGKKARYALKKGQPLHEADVI